MAYPSNDNKGAKNLVDFVVHLRDAEDAFGDVVNKAKEDITELINAVQGIDDTSTSVTGVWSSEKVSTEVAASNAAAQAAHNAADAAQASANAAQARADKGVADAATAKGVADKAASDLAAEISRAVAAEQAASNAAAVAQQSADAKLPLAGGTMTGDIVSSADRLNIKKNSTTGASFLLGGTDWNKGGFVRVSGQDNTDQPGWFQLCAYKDSDTKSLIGQPNGSLTWDGAIVLTTANGLAKSGGTMTGNITGSAETWLLKKTTKSGNVFLEGGTEWNNGAFIRLNGGDNASQPGWFQIGAMKDGNGVHFVGTPDGALLWNDKAVLTTANGLPLTGGKMAGNIDLDWRSISIPVDDGVIQFRRHGGAGSYAVGCNHLKADGTIIFNTIWEPTTDGKAIEYVDSQGFGWVRYTSGLQICWDYKTINKNVVPDGYSTVGWTFPRAFKDNVFVWANSRHDRFNAGTNGVSNTQATIYYVNDSAATFLIAGIDVFAIGRWK